MQNIWILNHYAGTSGGRHYKFAENLIERGYNVKVFRASSGHNGGQNVITGSDKYMYKEINGIPFIFIKARDYVGNGKDRIKNMLDYAKGLMSVSKKLDDEKPDIIYASSVHPLTWLAGYKLAKRYNAKFIAETRDLWPETFVAMGEMSKNSLPAKILYKLEKFIYKRADKLIFTIEGGKDYVENIGLGTSKVRYINNGIDLKAFYNNQETNIYKDNDLDEDGKFIVLYTGSMGPANGIQYLVESAKILQDKGIEDIKFVLFGDGCTKNALEEFVVKNKLKNIVFKGRVDKKYIPNILSKSNLNIFCVEHLPLVDKYGLSPNKLFDYFASGKPILSNIECGYDLIEHYESGVTVQGGSAEALVEGILKFYYMPKEEYDIYCDNALRAAENFDYKKLTDKLEKVILEDFS